MGRESRRAHRGATGEVALSLNGPLRYWHTVRHLRPVQLYGRLWFYLARPRPNPAPAPALRRKNAEWVRAAQREPSLTGPRNFIFLSEPGKLEEVGWEGPVREKLWRYHQHYFDDLNARDGALRANWHCELLIDWVRNNPAGVGNGWEPYPASLRIVNWIKWALAGNTLPDGCLHSLAVQSRWLTQRLEYHLLGNHLIANAKALVFAGLFFEGPETEVWLKAGMHILEREIPEQILGDGGHFERSTMYHALILEDLLDLCNVSTVFANALTDTQSWQARQWRDCPPAMIGWMNTMCHPDGEIAFFNDAAQGMAPQPAQLNAYAARLGFKNLVEDSPSSCWLRSSGYARLATPEAVALLDLAPIGPDYLPGHAHADTLSFELSVYGRRVLVNSGTSCYGISPERLRQRGTAAHNTVVVANEDSSEVWSSFRVARRARVLESDVQISPESLTATGTHDGYTRLPGGPLHQRRWSLQQSGLEVEDRVSNAALAAVACFHFHPDMQVVVDEGHRSGEISLAGGHRIRWVVVCGEAWIEPSTWHPRFGMSLPNTRLCVKLASGRSLVKWHWD